MFGYKQKNNRLTSKDMGPLLAIVIIYTIISFINLGSFKNPQTFWNAAQQKTAVISLGQPTEISKIRHFCGARFEDYNLYGAGEDGEFELIGDLTEEKVFKWVDTEVNKTYTYLKIEPKEEKEGYIGEIGVYNEQNQLVVLQNVENAENLIDEQEVIPEEISYLNSTYFDEIYHARTAYEYVNDLEVYEWTHPPLGKLIIAASVKAFGMNTFAYRLPGNIAGILMLIVIYVFAKRLFKETKYATAAGILLAADGMHFVQTRIATVDSFLVLFIMLSYLFMYQYITCEDDGSIMPKLGNLLMSGIFLGLSCATKWNGTYTAVGLAAIFFIDFFYRCYKPGSHHIWRQQALKILLCCVVFFALIPLGIYLLSYVPFMLGEEEPLKALWKLQIRMYDYHSKLDATHPYSSPWYLWPLTIKPVWYYDGQVRDGMVSSIALHANPFIWWTGILAVIYSIKEIIVERKKEFAFLLITILAAYVPYVFIPRIMFLYHYFPVVPMMILVITGVLQNISEVRRREKLVKWYTIIAVIVFVFFYPIYSGMLVPSWYAMLTEWLPQWNLY